MILTNIELPVLRRRRSRDPQRPSPTKEGTDLGYGSSITIIQLEPEVRIKLDFYDTNVNENLVGTDRSGDVWTDSTSLSALRMFDTGFAFSYDFAWGDNINGQQFFALWRYVTTGITHS